MEYIIIASAISAIVSALGGWYTHAYLNKEKVLVYLGHDKPILPIRWGDRATHEHHYDTMHNDGRGWVCGACGKPKAYLNK